jgi:hypothetical protein
MVLLMLPPPLLDEADPSNTLSMTKPKEDRKLGQRN